MPAFQRVFFFSNFLNHAFSYKVTKAPENLRGIYDITKNISVSLQMIKNKKLRNLGSQSL